MISVARSVSRTSVKCSHLVLSASSPKFVISRRRMLSLTKSATSSAYLFARRSFSTVESVPPSAANQNTSTSSSDSKKPPEDDDFLSKHGGKVAFVAFSIAFGLIYTYFLGTQDRSSVERAMETTENIIDPYELLELRYFNRLSESQLVELLNKLVDQLPNSSFPLLINHDSNNLSVDNTQDLQDGSSSNEKGIKRQIQNIPFWTYQQFIEFVKTNKSIIHENYYRPPQTPLFYNAISSKLSNNNRKDQENKNNKTEKPLIAPPPIFYHSHLLDRYILSQICQDFKNEVKNAEVAKFPSNKFNKKQEKEFLHDEKLRNEKGKIIIAKRNKELFRLYPFQSLNDFYSYHQLSSSSSTSSAATPRKELNYSDIPMALDYYLLILSNLMQRDQQSVPFPNNIYERFNILFRICLFISGYHQQLNSDEIKENLEKFQQKVISRDVMLRFLYLLQITNQIPVEKQVIETGVKWPVKLYRRKTPFDLIKGYEESTKKTFQEFTYPEFQRFLLHNYSCIWGICYSDKKKMIKIQGLTPEEIQKEAEDQ